jgi:hypothetical protein
VGILACYEFIHLLREQKRSEKKIDVMTFGIKVVVLMILIGLLIGVTNWVMTLKWPEF